jgi:hypothetical protein
VTGTSSDAWSTAGSPTKARPAAWSSGPVAASTPTVPKEAASSTTPVRGTRPWVGRNPKMPQYEAGTRTEPPVSVPMARGTNPPETAEAEPLDEPPGTRPGAAALVGVP